MNEETEIVHNRARIMCRRQVEDMKRNLLRQQEDDNYQTILAVRIREDVDIRKARTAEDQDLLHTEYVSRYCKDLVSSSQFPLPTRYPPLD
jgi:hypothetical protein